METAFYVAIILVSLLLMMVILLQSKASGFSGAFGGDTSAIYRTRRGLEKTLFQLTIGVAVIFVVLSLLGQWLL
ncbi:MULTISPECIES: preprotein translocase subunit SecG [Thermomicrobium]|uniref:Protein-export membrane protein SecG n=1 Tax=Thermomicrobium roseum (strain ATCC 27502 / DSM 5159 / P-2) TaxID=309801 RepID=B9KZ68_THERP|nr:MULTISPECIES: preprotein translocase subunit SecG [Thermomicrobium]ACM06121.1 preprotein translocase, SecG subunit [Thermomicrobium roseum DSM 5159]MBO9306635.1 preprotein translocase subunit SecG [Thermomicrobium sp.]MBO9360081.1 preprotein translocase subunit SecG [Thermomicrobium sp.]MBO9385478.1 preprotein translocase subunit SecG [Thermomicrobium sp.]